MGYTAALPNANSCLIAGERLGEAVIALMSRQAAAPSRRLRK